MALSLKHPFNSGKSDGADATLVQPSNWNASHTITAAVDSLVGTDSGGTTAKEIPCTTFGRSQIAAADLATWLSNTAFPSAVITWTGAQTVNAKLSAGQDFYLAGFITPTGLVADTNDWAPTNFATSSRLRVSASSAISLTGIAAGTEGRVIVLDNVGSSVITLRSENASSTAANRFTLAKDCPIRTGEQATLIYDGTSSRWRQLTATKHKLPTIQEFITGSANYTTPDGVTRIEVRTVAGGGGGGANGGAAGTVGVASSFNAIAAAPGNGGSGTSGVGPGAGGTGGSAGSGSATFRVVGQAGSIGGPGVASGAGGGGGTGGDTSFFGGGGTANSAGTTNTGGGGGGGTGGSGTGGGGGGGGGESFELWLTPTPGQVFAYVVGTGGAAGGGSAAAGAAGRIQVKEFYD